MSKWSIEFEHTNREERLALESDILIYAVGRLNNYKLPTTNGQRSFQGQIVDTAAWSEDLDIREKRVIVVGNGASAVQCVPAIQPGQEVSLSLNE